MTKLEQAARQLLDEIDTSNPPTVREKTITAMREALAEPKRYNHETGSTLVLEQAEQEPVAWSWEKDGKVINAFISKPYDRDGYFAKKGYFSKPLIYAAPVRTKDLTDDEIDEIFAEYGTIPNTKAVRAVIAADREKNRG